MPKRLTIQHGIYNGFGTRTSKTDSAGTHTFKRDGAGVTAPVVTDGFASYTPGVSERRSGTTTYSHSGLKNNAAQSGTGQTVGASRTYDAFGNVVASTGTFKGPFGYAGPFGYQEDGDSGLKLLGHRYYDSSTGRFLTRDPIKDGRNWYVYCDSNPMSFTDPEGLTQAILSAIFPLPSPRKRVVIIHGDRSGGMVLVGPVIRLQAEIIVRAEPGFRNGYDRTVLSDPNETTAVNAMVRSDAVVFIGHGSNGNLPLGGGDHQDQLDRVTVGRVGRLRKRPLDFALLVACESAEGLDWWKDVSRHTIGVDGERGIHSWAANLQHAYGRW